MNTTREVFTFELVLHFGPEYAGSVNTLMQEIRRALLRAMEGPERDGLADIEINLTERESVKSS